MQPRDPKRKSKVRVDLSAKDEEDEAGPAAQNQAQIERLRKKYELNVAVLERQVASLESQLAATNASYERACDKHESELAEIYAAQDRPWMRLARASLLMLDGAWVLMGLAMVSSILWAEEGKSFFVIGLALLISFYVVQSRRMANALGKTNQ
jgi:hypothetical protein